MDDRQQHTIRGRVALGATLEVRSSGGRSTHYYPPAVYTTALSQATIGPHLIKESFDNIVAYNTDSATPEANPHRIHTCDPAQYKAAIKDATLDGLVSKEFFEKFVTERAIYRVVRMPPHAQQAQVSGARQSDDTEEYGDGLPRTSQTPSTPRSRDDEDRCEHVHRPQSDPRNMLSRPVNTQVNQSCPGKPHTQHRHADALPEQRDAWAVSKRGRNYELLALEAAAPSPSNKPPHQCTLADSLITLATTKRELPSCTSAIEIVVELCTLE